MEYAHYQQVTRSKTLLHPVSDLDTILSVTQELLALTEVEHKPVRLLGLALSNLQSESSNESYVQFCLWNEPALGLLK